MKRRTKRSPYARTTLNSSTTSYPLTSLNISSRYVTVGTKYVTISLIRLSGRGVGGGWGLGLAIPVYSVSGKKLLTTREVACIISIMFVCLSEYGGSNGVTAIFVT